MAVQSCQTSSFPTPLSPSPITRAQANITEPPSEIMVSLSDSFIFDGGTCTLWWCGPLLSRERGIVRGGEILLSCLALLNYVRIPHCPWFQLAFNDVFLQSMFLEIFRCRRRKTVVLSGGHERYIPGCSCRGKFRTKNATSLARLEFHKRHYIEPIVNWVAWE